MSTITLHEAHYGRLEDLFHTTPDRRLRDRCHAILRAARGRRPRQMAEDWRSSVRPRPRWLTASHTTGLAGLPIPWAAPPISRSRGRPKSWQGSRQAPRAVDWTAPTGPRLR
jgi:hypothetical protein